MKNRGLKFLIPAGWIFLPALLLEPAPLDAGFSVPRALRPPKVLTGIASWYSPSDPGIGRVTASGEIFTGNQHTCASWQYDFGTELKVTNLSNGRSVICRVNDRGPSRKLNRLIDLSRAAFRKIEAPRRGLARVAVTPVRMPGGEKR